MPVANSGRDSHTPQGPSNYHGKPQPPQCPDFGTQGRQIEVCANFFPVKLPEMLTVYQYDVENHSKVS